MTDSIEWQRHKGILLDSAKGFDVIECERCGFKHIVPIPSAADLETMYRQHYYTKEKPLYLERHREDLEWWNLVYNKRFDFFEEHLLSHRRRVLDVGTGPGFFLLQGKIRGWRTLGIEPSGEAAAHGRELGLDVVEEFLDERMSGRLGTFDVVHLQDVLEHVPDPAGMLRLVGRLLEPEGLLCATVPNDYSSLQNILRNALGFEAWWIVPPHHINYFCFESMERLIRAEGYEVIHTTTTFPMEVFLFMGENYVGNDSIGRNIHGMRKAFELNLARTQENHVLDDLYVALAHRGVGRECVVMAKRP